MRHVSPPDITRADVGTILVSPWIVGTPERQRAAIAATLGEWERRPWPDGFISLSCFASSDGATVLNYAQWASDEAHHAFVRTTRPRLAGNVDAVVPGIERPGVVRYRLYGGGVSTAAHAPGYFVFVTAETDGVGRAREWVDGAFAALRAGGETVAGLISTHFHISVDGSRVLSYTEWRSEAAHRAAFGMDVAARDRAWRALQNCPGVRPISVTSYRHCSSLHADRAII